MTTAWEGTVGDASTVPVSGWVVNTSQSGIGTVDATSPVSYHATAKIILVTKSHLPYPRLSIYIVHIACRLGPRD